ncbi:MAG: hypothetical protein M2R45_00716 [Verrucomicrobia subdivision 3 bacterium]|nr:hypothetical protein [Limisphaerales bacterium]MCS1414400.1 hypothetical protein [Limisphaerales bacterium]
MADLRTIIPRASESLVSCVACSRRLQRGSRVYSQSECTFVADHEYIINHAGVKMLLVDYDYTGMINAILDSLSGAEA